MNSVKLNSQQRFNRNFHNKQSEFFYWKSFIKKYIIIRINQIQWNSNFPGMSGSLCKGNVFNQKTTKNLI